METNKTHEKTPRVIDLEEGRLLRAVKKGYRNWASRFGEEFGMETRLSHISFKTLSFLSQSGHDGTFYLYDLIMNLRGLGSGFEFNALGPDEKMAVIDRHLLLLDRVRFECMKRLGWLETYPGEECTLVELITKFDKLAPALQAELPLLSKDHPGYEGYCAMNSFDKDAFVRKLIPQALKEIDAYSNTL
ncbi:MAG: hypothetical protein GY849_12215 [Deltaproteobacteria bacterium]|nr:hypothetical protein [Deltaproteobacteria bacterium]